MTGREASDAAPARVGAIGLTVTSLFEDAYDIQIRGHHLTVDQPVPEGGANLGPTRPSCSPRA